MSPSILKDTKDDLIIVLKERLRNMGGRSSLEDEIDRMLLQKLNDDPQINLGTLMTLKQMLSAKDSSDLQTVMKILEQNIKAEALITASGIETGDDTRMERKENSLSESDLTGIKRLLDKTKRIREEK